MSLHYRRMSEAQCRREIAASYTAARLCIHTARFSLGLERAFLISRAVQWRRRARQLRSELRGYLRRRGAA